jgi:tetratricopeptide (TPR) repeat protein
MHRSIFALPLVGIAISAPAHAGEEPLYEPAPAWVDVAGVDSLISEQGPATILYDWQHRLEDGVAWAYVDWAQRIDNPQSLMQLNTQTLQWLPDKGDLTIHRLEVYRDGEVIDLLGQGVTFDVLRREQGLEDRLLDGSLTATVSVPGLREGDVLRIAHSISTDDQALGDEVQATQYLPTQPWQVQNARATLSWPADEEIFWDVEDRVDLPEPELRDGYRYIRVDLPLAEPDPVPMDAPTRYRRPSILRAGSFADWQEVSAVMAPHFDEAASVAEGSEVAALARDIMAQSDDPLTRAALAVRLVQDEVSYLLNGLDGGNYLPQSADETWDVRYGDCKAKTVLLLALLRQMDIDAEPVLVSTQMGDAIPELLPLPAAFDHVIVHAVIDETDYWLDGTSAATRLATIANVPPFHYALPLREGGAQLVPMTQRDLAVPQMRANVTMDHSAGIDFPALMRVEMTFVGPGAAQMQAMVDAENPAMLRAMARNFSGTDDMAMQVSSLEISYDEEEAVATLHVEGISQPQFEWVDGRLRSSVNPGDDFSEFNPNRARPAWREIPVATPGPMRQAFGMRMVLPQDGAGFRLEGDPLLEMGFGNTRVTRRASIEGGELHAMGETFALLGEIPASDLPEARRAARRISNSTLELVPPESVTWRWELDDAERNERAAPLLEGYDAAIDFADEDDFTPLMARALFLRSIYDFDAAIADFDALVEEQPSAWAYVQRSWLHRTRGNTEAMLADLQAAYELDLDNNTAREIAREMAYEGRFEEARELLGFLTFGDDEMLWYYEILASIAATEGDLDDAIAHMADAVAEAPQSSDALNADCWFRGLWNTNMDDALTICTQAVERASNAAAALDSRALIRFRQGDYEGAIADLDGALAIAPGLAESHYLRGMAKMHAGMEGGEDDLAIALRMAPHLAEFYTRHGIVAPD